MKTISTLIKIFAIALGLLYTMQSHAQQIKDVFVLVDQSGTMNNSTINGEAKQIICDMITGQLNLSNWSVKGWGKVSAGGNFFNNTVPQMIKNGGKLCLIPFGNMERVRDFSITSYTDNQSTQYFISNHFPSYFNDSFTYLDLAKAFTVDVAKNNSITGKIFLIVYSDGMGDYDKSNLYPDDLQVIMDYYGTDNYPSLNKKIGLLRKNAPNRRYNIEVWEMGPISQIPTKGGDTIPPPPPLKLSITSPKDGESIHDQIIWKNKEENTISWKNANGSVKINIQGKDKKGYSNLSGKERTECYKVTIGVNSAKIKFFKSGDYHIIVADSKGNDDRYVHVKAPFPFNTLVIIILFAIAIWLIFRFILPRPTPRPDPEPVEGEWD